jgi:hypothetical protein
MIRAAMLHQILRQRGNHALRITAIKALFNA